MTLDQSAVGVQPIGAQPSLELDFQASEAVRFLELLSKDPAQTWLRFLKPTGGGGGADQKGISTQKHQAQVQQRVVDGLNVYAVIGTADKATGKGGGVLDADITQCPALFVEWDDGAPVEEQQDRWLFLYGLPEPTVQVSTGGKSVHAYWALSEAITPERWRQITTRLIAHCKADEACKNPGRVMRLPGSVYHDKKTGQPIGQCRIITGSGLRYTASEIEACLTRQRKNRSPLQPTLEGFGGLPTFFVGSLQERSSPGALMRSTLQPNTSHVVSVVKAPTNKTATHCAAAVLRSQKLGAHHQTLQPLLS